MTRDNQHIRNQNRAPLVVDFNYGRSRWMKILTALTGALVGVAAGHLNSPSAWCDEPNQLAADSDEEIYGKHAIGPKSPTPLDQAVAEFNKKAAEHPFNTDFPERQHEVEDHERPEPLTVDEVLKAISNRDPETYTPQNPATPRLEGILKSQVLPPHSKIAFSDQWIALSAKIGRERRTWRISLDMMTGKNQGASFAIREQVLDSRKRLQPRPGFRWVQEPRPRDKNGRWVGWFDNRLKVSFGPDREVIVVNTTRSNDALSSLKVVAFDEKENRYDLDGRKTGAEEGAIAESFRLDPARLRPENVKYVGIEGVMKEDQAPADD